MGGKSSIQVHNLTINLNEYKCSKRGLILPSGYVQENLSYFLLNLFIFQF